MLGGFGLKLQASQRLSFEGVGFLGSGSDGFRCSVSMGMNAFGFWDVKLLGGSGCRAKLWIFTDSGLRRETSAPRGPGQSVFRTVLTMAFCSSKRSLCTTHIIRKAFGCQCNCSIRA